MLYFRLLVLVTRIGHQMSDETFSTVSDFLKQVSIESLVLVT